MTKDLLFTLHFSFPNCVQKKLRKSFDRERKEKKKREKKMCEKEKKRKKENIERNTNGQYFKEIKKVNKCKRSRYERKKNAKFIAVSHFNSSLFDSS